MAKEAVDITEKQARMIRESRRAVQQAMAQSQITIQAIEAGIEVPEGGQLENVTEDPPQLVYAVPDEEEDDSGDS